MTRLSGKFVWFEHHSSAVPTAHRFYDALFGWQTDMLPVGDDATYPLIRSQGQGIGGYREVHPGTPSQWLGFLSVDDVDAACRAAQAAGAQVIEAPRAHGSSGRGAVLADPQGAVFSVWTDAKGDAPDVNPTPPGAWCWAELYTPRPHDALAFYERVFGYRHDTMDLGPLGTYYLLQHGEVARAGLMRSANDQALPMWLPYVAVDDCDATAGQARALGGQVLHGPVDVPSVGRYCILVDPVGAALAAMRLFPDGT